MEGTYQLIIRKPYDDIPKEFIEWISENAGSYLFAQHDADAKTKSTHVHLSFSNLAKCVKTLDKQRIKHELNGAASVLFSTMKGTKTKYDEGILNTYCLKGDVTKCKKSNYLPQALEAWAGMWVVPKENVVDDKVKNVKKEKEYDEWDVMKKDFFEYYNDIRTPSITLSGVRSWTMRWYWKRDGRMPPATSYKRNAASLYVYAMELSGKEGSVDAAFEELKELWY